MLTATTLTPDPANSFWKRSRDGISWIQGGHQVAQKFRTSTFPPNETGVTESPESDLIANSGAGPPSLADVSRRLYAITPTKVAIKATRRIRSAELIVKSRLMAETSRLRRPGMLHNSEYRILPSKHPISWRCSLREKLNFPHLTFVACPP